MKNTCPFYIVFQVLKVLLIMNICQLKPSDLISFYFYKLLHQQILFFRDIELASKNKYVAGLQGFFCSL